MLLQTVTHHQMDLRTDTDSLENSHKLFGVGKSITKQFKINFSYDFRTSFTRKPTKAIFPSYKKANEKILLL